MANAVHSAAADSLDESDDPSTEFIGPQHPLATGQVVAVDRAAGTITIRHKPIPDVFMTETMTMIFRVTDRSMLEGHRSGDTIRFRVERAGKSFVVVWIENSN
jgi:Cu/Ag efflux protein CusF